MMQTTTGRFLTWSGSASLALVCLVILFANLGSVALFDPDEGRNAEKAREILLLDDWVTPHHNFLPTLDKPIFFFWVVALSFKLFGLTEAAARLPSVLAALSCILVVYGFARRQWGMGAALWSGLVLVTNIGFFVFARLVIFDMLLTLFVTLALLSFYAAAQSVDPRRQRLYGLAMCAALGLGTLVKGAVGIVIPGMVIGSYVALARQWSVLPRLGLGRGALVYCAITFPWYLWAEARNDGYLQYFLWEEHFTRYLTPEFEREQVGYYFVLVVAAGFFPWSTLLPWTIVDLWRRKNLDPWRFLALWALLPILFFSFSSSQLPQYILPVFPALALMTGRFVATRVAGQSGSKLLLVPWLCVVTWVVYLLIGAAWPQLLVRHIRDTVTQNLLPLAGCGIVLLIVLGLLFYRSARPQEHGRRRIYLAVAVGLTVLFVVLGELTIGISLERSSKPVAAAAAPFIGPDDRVVFYDTFLPGLAFYLRAERPIWIVQREGRERIIGSNYLGQRLATVANGHGQVLYSFAEFAREWKRSDRVLRVVVKEKNLRRLIANVDARPRVLTQYDEYLLVTNR